MMKRLEAATSRLEDLTVVHAETLKRVSEKAVGAEATGSAANGNRLEARESGEGKVSSTASAPAGAGAAESKTPREQATSSIIGTGGDTANADLASNAAEVASAESSEPTPVQISEYKEIMKGPLTHLLLLSAQFGDPIVEEAVTYLIKVFEGQLKLLRYSFLAKKPDYHCDAFTSLHREISSHAQNIIDLRESNRGSKFFNHLSDLAEGVPGMGWTTCDDAVGILGDFRDSAQFYANRIMKEFRGVDDKQFEWAKTSILVLNDLQAYVKKYYPKGLTWNPQGESLDEVIKSKDSKDLSKTPSAEKAASASAGGAPAPPPPPPPPPMPADSVFKVSSDTAGSPSSGAGMNAVFSELNKGEDITKSLKKVDKKRSTPPPPKKPANLSHKKSTASVKPASPPKVEKQRPARTELLDTKWIVENHVDQHEIKIQGEMNQGVFIDRCKNCTIQITGKVSAITLNECHKVGVVAENLVSGVDVIKSSGFGIQVTGALPTLSIDQSQEGQVYLSKESLNVDIYTSQTSAINIELPKNEEEGDYTEAPLPEQMRHHIADGKIVSEVVEHM